MTERNQSSTVVAVVYLDLPRLSSGKVRVEVAGARIEVRPGVLWCLG